MGFVATLIASVIFYQLVVLSSSKPTHPEAWGALFAPLAAFFYHLYAFGLCVVAIEIVVLSIIFIKGKHHEQQKN